MKVYLLFFAIPFLTVVISLVLIGCIVAIPFVFLILLLNMIFFKGKIDFRLPKVKKPVTDEKIKKFNINRLKF